MLNRVLEPEVMDTAEEARCYDAMDHSEVNQRFVDDLLGTGQAHGEVLDLGTGTALIPVRLCRQTEAVRVYAVDLSCDMLELARLHVEVHSLLERILLDRVDAKSLPFVDHRFDVVMSNSIVHHIAEPASTFGEAIRVCRPGGLLFFRDLLRPATDQDVARLVAQYAGQEPAPAQKMFDDSLRAAFSLEEIRTIVVDHGFAASSVFPSSDRHWTWQAVKPGADA